MSKKENYALNSNKIQHMTSDLGAPITNDTNSLTISDNGPILMKDLHFLEKMGHFNRERTPERVIHAKGTGAYGYFETTNCMRLYTRGKLFHKTGEKIPVFVRFSTVIGSKGSADTVREPRGFAVRFYTNEGNYDIVGNHIPVFFIRDAMKFPDLVHALKPAPNNNLGDKNRIWDFMSLNPETTNMLTYIFSDVGTIKSFRRMEGHSVNSFIWINEDGERNLIKYKWKPLLGVETIDSKEAINLAGKDPDVAIRDLYETIENGGCVQYDLYVQLVSINDKDYFRFDLEDATKIWPEEIFKPIKVGRLILNKNPSNYFQETEQVAFSPTNLIPGIEFSNDKLLQGRLVPYRDTQFHRIGSNYNQLPINLPKTNVNNNQQEGSMRYYSKSGKVNYTPNTLDNNNPKPAHFIGKENTIYLKGNIERKNIKKIDDYFQAGERYRNMSKIDKEHLVCNLIGAISGIDEEIKKRVLENFMKADKDLVIKLERGLKNN